MVTFALVVPLTSSADSDLGAPGPAGVHVRSTAPMSGSLRVAWSISAGALRVARPAQTAGEPLKSAIENLLPGTGLVTNCGRALLPLRSKPAALACVKVAYFVL